MPEQTQTQSPAAESVEEKPCSSSAAAAANDDGAEVLEEAKKLLGTGNRHLVMGDVVSAVAVFQDACSLLSERFGDTAYECGEALFLCGKSLLELARMENTVLGNALEGVPEEDEGKDQEEQPNSKIESANNLDADTREELRKQVYEAMAEEERTNSTANRSPPRKDPAGETTEGAEAKEEALETPAAEGDGKEEEEESMEDEGNLAQSRVKSLV
uniref:Nuclear autoantigenic sperm protein n=1 Tax=Knipowitschia caucasica TaxID=637954 RepID=A0AAV2KQ97_KNICA